MKKNKLNNRLVEVMAKVNNLTEDSRPYDVRAMERDLNIMTNVTNSKGRIDNINEFKPAFEVWFQTLGFDPKENPIQISRVRNDIDKVLRDLGYV
jgi:hypothetical protein